MYQNKVNLIGFLGSDAEVHTANNRSFTTLSLATKSSYKDKSGQYVSHTEWHRCVVFGKLSEFAGTLTKARTSRSRASFVAGSTTARRPTRDSASGRSAWIRSSSWTGPRWSPQKSRQPTTLRARSRPHRPLLFTFGSLAPAPGFRALWVSL
jgi:single-strand DNA-binding protein